MLVRRAAELDLAAIEDWYDTQQEGLSAEFRGAVGDVFRRIGDNPLSYPERYRENRRALLRRFPYVVWYRVQADSAIVLACIHGGRDPRLVRARLQKDV